MFYVLIDANLRRQENFNLKHKFRILLSGHPFGLNGHPLELLGHPFRLSGQPLTR